MAWRAILRRCRFMDQGINFSNMSIPISHSFARGFSTHNLGDVSLLKDNPLKISELGFFKSRFFGVTNWDLNAPIGLRWIHQTQKVRPFSTAATKQAEHRSEILFKKRREASPVECDQAVEGLTTVKAQGKRLQESQKDTVKEMTKEVQNSCSGGLKQTAEDLDGLSDMVRRGASVSNEEILGFAKLFNDELTLDNISRPHLINMCKHMGISPVGTDAYLCYMLRKHLQRIKEDDKLIQAEGVDSLSEAELREDCRERGMLGLLSVEEMRQQLQHWLDLSLNHSVPSSLLILSRVFNVSGRIKPEQTVHATFFPFEDTVSKRRRKLVVLEVQEELMKEEDEREGVKQTRMEINSEQDYKALKEMNISSAKEAHKLARAKAVENQEQLCELSRALSVLASTSAVSTEHGDFLRLFNEEIEHYKMVEKEATNCEKEAFKPCKVAREDDEHSFESDDWDKMSSALREKADAMLQDLKKEIDGVDARIGVHWRLLDRDYDTKVTLEEVASAAMYVKDTLGKVGIEELISSLSKVFKYKEKDLESEELDEGLKHEEKGLEFKELNEGLEPEKKDLEFKALNEGLEHEKKDFKSNLGYEEKDLESEESIRDLYDRWRARNPRKFRDLHEKEERYNIFKEKLKYCHEVNQKNLSYKLGLTPFIDWTMDEYRRILSPNCRTRRLP